MSNLLTDFTFSDTGITVKIRKVSPMIAADIANAYPEPTPPSQEVDYGEPKGKVMEQNLSDPEYLKAVKARQVKVVMAIQRMMISRGVVLENDDWKSEVEQYKESLKSFTGYDLEEDDLLIYVFRICVGTQEDLEDLLAAITSRSQPTDIEVEKSKASFRGKV